MDTTRYIYIRYIYDDITIDEYGQTKVETIVENVLDSIVFYVNKLHTSVAMGNGSVLGLSVADNKSWYMGMTTLDMSGISVISSNPFIASDNIITSINNKLNQYLSESNYNYYKNAKFLLYIKNDLNNLNTYIGTITSFDFDRNKDCPDEYSWNLKFEGKPYIEQIKQKAVEAVSATTPSASEQMEVTRQMNIQKVQNLPPIRRG